MKSALLLGALALLGGVAVVFWPATPPEASAQTDDAPALAAGLVKVTLPDQMSANAQIGQRIYEATCAACHGVNAQGQDGVAPPLVHKIYEPGHHGDDSFVRAATQGVRAHHWPFGDMPAVPGITSGDVAMIVAYIRELQRANGIY